MFETILYNCDDTCRNLNVWRRKTFNTFSAAQMWADKFSAIELDEFENGDEFAEVGEYNFVDLYYEIIAL